MDEVFGYFPPHPADPPTKKPLLTLLKQARAQGVGVLLATQNPVDLDYKGLANMGTWLVGKLQTEQDRERLREGLAGSGGVDAAAARTPARADAQARVPAPRRSPARACAAALALDAVLSARPADTRGDFPADGGPRRGPAPSAAVADAAPALPPPLRHHYLEHVRR